MSKVVALIGFLICFALQPSFGQEAKTARNEIVGTWRVVSYDVEVQVTGERSPVMGKPSGYVVFLPEGRVFFILTGGDRKPPTTDRERAELLETLVAYAGTYSMNNDEWTTNVEVAWDPEWIGTKQVRLFKLDGDRLVVTTPWRIMPNWADKGETRSIVTFERENSMTK